MPAKDKKGPPSSSQGPRTGKGQGKGRQTNSPGVGRKKGGRRGTCK